MLIQAVSEMKKLCHFCILDGTEEDIRNLSKALGEMKDKLGEVEFLVTNERIQMRDIKGLIDSLYTLYKKEKALIESKTVNKSE